MNKKQRIIIAILFFIYAAALSWVYNYGLSIQPIWAVILILAYSAVFIALILIVGTEGRKNG